jgi:hypothetical protein
MAIIGNGIHTENNQDGKPSLRVIAYNDENIPFEVELVKKGLYLNDYSEANGVASQATVTVINYTVPIGKIFRMESVDYSSDCIGIFTVELNGSTESKQYTNYTKYTGAFKFSGFDLNAGDSLKLIIENKSNGVGSFNANLQGRLIDV